MLCCAALYATAAAGATIVFSDGFNDYQSGSFTDQPATGLHLGAFGTLNAWDAAGIHAVHAVDRTGNADWAVMLYAGPAGPNVITTKAAFAGNISGVTYAVDFETAAAAYSSDIEGTSPTEFLRFDVLRADASSVYTYTFKPANWTGNETNPFDPGHFTYVGDGSGDVKLRILGVSESFDGRFGGAIDNVRVTAVPEPASWGLMLIGFGAIGHASRRRVAAAAARC